MPKSNIVQLHLAKQWSGRPLGSHCQTNTYPIMCSNAKNEAEIKKCAAESTAQCKLKSVSGRCQEADCKVNRWLKNKFFEQRPGATVVISDTGCWLFARKQLAVTRHSYRYVDITKMGNSYNYDGGDHLGTYIFKSCQITATMCSGYASTQIRGMIWVEGVLVKISFI